jgi:FK506-binding protein 4/5
MAEGQDSTALKDKDVQTLRSIKDCREGGNVLFREGKFREAMKKYHHANLYLKCFQDNPMGFVVSRPDQVTSMSNLPEKVQVEIQSLTVLVTNNMAACALKLQNWESALRHTAAVLELDPDNQKAIYRKGCACLNLNKIDEAIKYLRRAHELDSKDPAVKKQLANAYQKMKEYHEKERAMFKGIFVKSEHNSESH